MIRPFRSDDLDALYRISLATGHAGGDASHLYADPRLMGHIYAAPYALLEPRLALVVEDGDGVAGFAVGTTDTMAWERRLERNWWPALRERYALPAEADAARWTPDQRRAFAIHRPALTPPAVARPYPAHLHLNLLPRLHGRGVGTSLFDRWTSVASTRGAKALHVAVNRANIGAAKFWRKMGFVDLALGLPEGRTLWLGRP
ncbi:GNAT family N-acetyltransferase [Reyranella sp.]|uniref:GNAT family N-acetyltransferase n=1 Tax=Reyranella sp. TaxID=1929291 RepID=UPI003D117C07